MEAEEKTQISEQAEKKARIILFMFLNSVRNLCDLAEIKLFKEVSLPCLNEEFVEAIRNRKDIDPLEAEKIIRGLEQC